MLVAFSVNASTTYLLLELRKTGIKFQPKIPTFSGCASHVREKISGKRKSTYDTNLTKSIPKI